MLIVALAGAACERGGAADHSPPRRRKAPPAAADREGPSPAAGSSEPPSTPPPGSTVAVPSARARATELEVGGKRVTWLPCEAPFDDLPSLKGVPAVRSLAGAGGALLLIDASFQVHRWVPRGGASCAFEDVGPEAGRTLDPPPRYLSASDAGRVAASTALGTVHFLGPSAPPPCRAAPLGLLALAPDGRHGVGFYRSDELRRIVLDERGRCRSEPWLATTAPAPASSAGKRGLPSAGAGAAGVPGAHGDDPSNTVDDVGTVLVLADRVLVAASGPGGFELTEYGTDGGVPRRWATGDIHDLSRLVSCDPGVCGLEPGHGRVHVWKRDGSPLGAVPVLAVSGAHDELDAARTTAGLFVLVAKADGRPALGQLTGL